MTAKIIVVDDDSVFRKRLVQALSDRNYSAFEAENIESAISINNSERPSYGIIDLKMPGANGLDVIKELIEKNPSIKLLMLTGYGSIATAVEAIKLGAINYLNKPASIEMILKNLSEEKSEINSAVPSLEEVEWEHINRVVNECSGNITKAARVLGLHRRSLQRKLLKNCPISFSK